MKTSILTEKLNYDFVGKDYDIFGVSYYDEANETDLAVVFHESEINKTKANVVLTAPTLVETSKTLIMAYDNIDFAMVKVCKELIQEGILPNYELPINKELLSDGYYLGINCSIDETARIYSGVVIGNDVKIAKNCVIEPFVVIGSGVEIAEGVHIGSGSKIGAESFYHFRDENENLKQFFGCGKTIIGKETSIGNHTVIQRGTLSDTVIGNHCMIGNNVDIGHDVKIGDNCKIVSQTGIAGQAVLKNDIMVYGQVGIANRVTIGNHAVIKAKTLVSKPVQDNEVVFGLFGRNYAEELRLAGKLRNFFDRKVGK